MSNVYISKEASEELIEYLWTKGHEPVFVMPLGDVHPAVSAHPDIYMCKLGAGPEAEVFHGDWKKLTMNYPGDTIYNAVCMGKYFIHRLSSTSPELLERLRMTGINARMPQTVPVDMPQMVPVDVPQGYTKCNMVVVDEKSAITSDEGIAKALQGTDIELLIISKGHVRLEGFDYGFLGGASGRVGEEIIFNGDLSRHPDYELIRDFILKRGLKIKYFENYELEDIGSVIEEIV